MKHIGTHKYIALVAALFVIALPCSAQNISATADRDKILIGEQITLQLKADNLKEGITQWFALPDTVNHLEVVQRGKIDTIQIAGNNIFQQTITLTSFDSGHWQIPALTLVTASNARFTTKAIGIDVLPVDVSQLQDYHDIKEIIAVEEKSNPWIIVLIALITLVSLAALYWFIRKKQPAPVALPKVPNNLSPAAWAQAELQKLQQEDLIGQNKIKLHYQRLTDISRQYFYLQLQHPSLHQTTSEWMVLLHGLPVNAEVRTSFLQLLRLADAVKFARYQPPSAENEQSVSAVAQVVNEVANWQNKLHQSNPKQS